MKWFLHVIVFIPYFNFGQLTQVVHDWESVSNLKNASLSFCVIDLSKGEIIVSKNENLSLTPASTLKLVSTSAALALLGNEFKYETKLYYKGNFDKKTGILYGDLIISGTGDPTLQSENFYKDSENVCLQWAKILKEKGLQQIKGAIIGDASFFERKVPNNWIWEDISNYYGAVPNGLSFVDNKLKVNYLSGEKGSIAKIISTSPNYITQSLTLQSTVKAGANKDDAFAYGDPFSFHKEINGTIPANKKNYEIEIALPDPALMCAEKVYEALMSLGISCESNSISSTYSAILKMDEAQLIYTHYSPTLDKIIYYTNQTSNNQYCESILYTLGNGNADKGLSKIKTYWQQNGLDTSELYMEDASGLGRINTLTTHFQATLLYKISLNKHIYPILKNSLPLAGKQGSMRNIGKGTFIENNLRAKTGYMKRVRAYSGYLTSKSGKELAYSLIFNNYNCSASEAKTHMEKFLIALGEL